MEKPDYGLDAPGVVRGFLFGGPALFAAGYFLIPWAKAHFAPLIGFGHVVFYTGIVLFIESRLLMGYPALLCSRDAGGSTGRSLHSSRRFSRSSSLSPNHDSAASRTRSSAD